MAAEHEKAACALVVGEVVRETASGDMGRVMGHEGPYFQIRPLGGGRERDVRPDQLERLADRQQQMLADLDGADASRGEGRNGATTRSD